MDSLELGARCRRSVLPPARNAVDRRRERRPRTSNRRCWRRPLSFYRASFGSCRFRQIPNQVSRLVASGYQRVGQIDHYLQNFNQAVDAYQECIDSLQNAPAESARDPKLRSKLSEVHYGLGQSLAELARFEEAMSAYDRAAAIARELARRRGTASTSPPAGSNRSGPCGSTSQHRPAVRSRSTGGVCQRRNGHEVKWGSSRQSSVGNTAAGCLPCRPLSHESHGLCRESHGCRGALPAVTRLHCSS